MLRAKAESDVKAIVDEIAGRPQPACSVERKIALRSTLQRFRFTTLQYKDWTRRVFRTLIIPCIIPLTSVVGLTSML